MNNSDMAPAEKPTNTVQLLWRLWSDYLSNYLPRLMLALAAMGILALTYSAIPFAIEAISAAFTGNEQSPKGRFRPNLEQVIAYGPFILAGIGLLYALSQYAQSRLTLGAALDTLQDIQNGMIARFLALDLNQQRLETSGALTSRFTNDIQLLRESLTRTTNGVRDFLQLVALCGTLIFYDWVLFTVVILVYAVIGWPIAWLGKILRRTAASAQAETGNLASTITEISNGSAIIKSYRLETRKQSDMKSQFEKRTGLLKKAAYLRAVNEPFIFLVGAIAMGAVVAVIAMRIRMGAIDGPEVAGFLVALLLLSQPARGLSTLYAVLQEGLASFERMLSIVDQQPTIVEAPDAHDLTLKNAEITFDKVSFSYAQQDHVLKDITLSIPSGTSLALVGESGAGKTSLMHLLPRLYDVTGGSIRIGGQDIRSTKISSLRDNISIVSQDTVIFNQSLSNNIALGKLDADDTDIKRAAKAAAIHDFIDGLPDGYATLAGENGHRLSGGQRQRIAIARAFLKQAPILLLDEPTSALDAESEAILQIALNDLQQGRTTLIIAHRLATIRNADMIAVMDRGQIIEQGTHDELMRKNDIYARLVELQFGS